MLNKLSSLDIDHKLILDAVADESGALLTEVAQKVRMRFLAECFMHKLKVAIDTSIDSNEELPSLPQLDRTDSVLPLVDSDETYVAPSALNSSFNDDGCNFTCKVCGEVTMFSSDDLLPDESYRNVCLTDSCIKDAIGKYSDILKML